MQRLRRKEPANGFAEAIAAADLRDLHGFGQERGQHVDGTRGRR